MKCYYFFILLLVLAACSEDNNPNMPGEDFPFFRINENTQYIFESYRLDANNNIINKIIGYDTIHVLNSTTNNLLKMFNNNYSKTDLLGNNQYHDFIPSCVLI